MRFTLTILVSAFLALSQSLTAVPITFRVDMSGQALVSLDGVHLVGSMNGWNPATDSLAHIGNDIYELTLDLPMFNLIEYQFVNGNAWGQEEVLYGDCSFAGARVMYTPSVATAFPTACFGSCDSVTCGGPPQNTRIACMGNSITRGFGLNDQWQQTYAAYMQDSLGPTYTVENFGATGQSVVTAALNSYWNHRYLEYALAYEPDTCFVMFGTNASKAAIWDLYANQFLSDYDSLVKSFKALPSDPEMIAILPPGSTPNFFGIRDSVLVGEVFPQIQEAARLNCMEVVDMHWVIDSFPGFFPDGVHPNIFAQRIINGELMAFLRLPRPQIAFSSTIVYVTTSGYRYQWYRDGRPLTPSEGGQAQVLQTPAPGLYKVSIQPDSASRNILLSQEIEILPVGIADGMERVGVYPNPFQNELRFAGSEMGLSWKIWDLQGRLMGEGDGLPDALNTATWRKGFYCLQLDFVGERIVKKLVKR